MKIKPANMISTKQKATIILVLILSYSFSTYAQNYPVETITILTHSRPGGGSDVFLRELSRYLAPELGANIIVKNVTGGSGASAIAELVQSAAGWLKILRDHAYLYLYLAAFATGLYLSGC